MAPATDYLLPISLEIARALKSKPGVHLADHKMVAGWISQHLHTAIQKGKFNLPDTAYEETVARIRMCGPTQMPGLLYAVVEAAYLKETFVDGGASEHVRKCEQKLGKSAQETG